VLIFATDIDDDALAIARDGSYTLNDVADVTPERLSRYFNKDGDGYRVRKEIREMILFASHNFIKDPPFSRLDLVTCRNVLIYLNRTAQERVMETFHFALNAGGYLFLGSSESADGAPDLFTTMNRTHHIFQGKQVGMRRYPIPESSPGLKSLIPYTETPNEVPAAVRERVTFGDLHQRLLEEYAPPSLVVNEDYDIVHLSEQVGRYLQMSGGNLSQNLLKLVRTDLRLELRSALLQAAQKKTAILAKGVRVHIDNEVEIINIIVRPAMRDGDIAKGFLLVIFDKQEGDVATEPEAQVTDEPAAKHLETELVRIKSQLRSSVEQHDFHAEEWKAANEELQAMNEELRSAAEELETSKEELQSINEELRTVNQELKVKIEETTLSTNNLHNLINSASIGTIFLDRAYRIALFTPAVCEIFNLIPTDYGRPLSDITHHLRHESILRDANTVLEKLQPIEQEVTTKAGKVFLMRISPYRTAEDQITGLVLTFVDISSRIEAQNALLRSEERLRLATQAADLYTWEVDMEDITDPQSVNSIIVQTALPPQTKKEWGKSYLQEKNRLAQEMNHAVRKSGQFELEFYVDVPDQSREWFYVAGISMWEKKPARIIGITQNITKRKLTEIQLRNSENNLRTLTDLVPQLSWRNDDSGRFIHFNQRWVGYSGLDIDSFADGWRAIIHPDDLQETMKAWEKAQASGEIFEHEFRLRRADGNYSWHIGRAVPAKDEDGAVKEWFGSATDIETLKQTQEFLRATKERLKVTFESASDFAIITFDTQGKIEGWSNGAELIFGYNENEIIGKPGAILFTPEDIRDSAPEKEIATAIETGRAIDERWHMHKDGHRFFMSGVMSPINLEGVLTGFVKIARDVTQRWETEQALLLSEERYRIVLQSADMGAWDWNVVSDRIIWNDQHYTLFGLDPTDEHINGAKFLENVHPEDAEMIREKIRIAVEETGLYEAEFRIIRGDNGMVRWMNGYGRSVASTDGRATRMVGVMFDITERKILERQKDEFIGIASHELKTPVTGIKGYVEMLKYSLAETDGSKLKLVEKLEHQVDRLISLIKDLLDITKISEGQLNLRFQKVDLNELIIESIDDLKNLSTKHNISFTPTALPEVKVDQERIVQVITNLISNAVKYSPKGGDVVIRSEVDDQQIAVSVRDFGIGIPAQLKDKVFERFFRVNHSQINSFPGMGLGLYITAEIVYRHGGNIWVESGENEGSTFWFTIPHKNGTT
jgi:PAS domain S-box-containing protein